MVKIKAREPFLIAGEAVEIGSEHDVAEGLAQMLVNCDRAELVEPPPAPAAEPVKQPPAGTSD